MNNLKYHQFFFDAAKHTAELSYARRNKVGCILVKDNHIICNSFNGTPPGFDNNCEDELPDGSLVTKDDVVHAEMNAIYFCAKHGIKISDTKMYLTLSPCKNCALAILQSGITAVYYLDQYRCTDGIYLLRNHGIICEKGI